MIGFDEFNKKIMGMPGRKGSVVDYWNSLTKKELISLMEGQNLYIDLFMERGDKLEKKVNNLSRDKRDLKKEIRNLS